MIIIKYCFLNGQKTLIETFNKKKFYKPATKVYDTIKTVVKHIVNTWSLDLLVMTDNEIKNNGVYRFISVVINNSSEKGFGIPLKKYCAQSITNEFYIIIHQSNLKPSVIETHGGNESPKSFFTDFVNINDIKRCSRCRNKRAVFAERFNRTIRDLLEEPVFEKISNWIELLAEVLKISNNNIHSSTKTSPIKARKKSNETEVFNNIRDKRKKRNQNSK